MSANHTATPTAPAADTGTPQIPEGAFPLVLFRGVTAEKFAGLPDCEWKLELIDGNVLMAAKPRVDHQEFLGELFVALRAWVRAHSLGRILFDIEVRLNSEWAPAPDLVWVSNEHSDRIAETHVEGAVDLAVEILSPSTRGIDRGRKFEAFAQAGITWYWVVDVAGGTLDEYQAVDGRYQNHVTHPFDRPFPPRCFPGLTIDLAALRR